MRENGLERTGVALGAILLLIAIFAPWLDLSLSLSDGYLHELSPWTCILSGESPLVVMGVGYLVLMTSMLYHIAHILRSVERHSRMRRVGWVILCGIAMLLVIVGALTALPVGLELGYPYYDVAIGIGGWVAGAGALCIMSTAVASAMSTQRAPARV